MSNDYPASPSGEPPFDRTNDLYDTFQTLSYLAGITDTIHLGPNICIAPLRHPISLIKQAFTLDALSGGRFEFGIGVGWLREEYDALGVPFEERGSRTDEFLEILHKASEEGNLAYDGEYYSFDRVSFTPVPKDGRPTLLIGGKSGATFRRIAQYGDGWTIGWLQPDQIHTNRNRLHEAWTDYDRSGAPDIAVIRPVHVGTDTDRSLDTILVGEPATIVEDICAYEDAGTTQLIIQPYANTVDGIIEQIARFGDDVIPSL